MTTVRAKVIVFAVALSLLAACGGSSPTRTFQTAFDAMKRKDAAALRKTFSKFDTEKLEEASRMVRKPSDEVLANALEGLSPNLPDRLETRNDKVNGDIASVEYKTRGGEWKTAHFQREGGEWKFIFEDFRP